jgi:hypothetical protein
MDWRRKLPTVGRWVGHLAKVERRHALAVASALGIWTVLGVLFSFPGPVYVGCLAVALGLVGLLLLGLQHRRAPVQAPLPPPKSASKATSRPASASIPSLQRSVSLLAEPVPIPAPGGLTEKLHEELVRGQTLKNACASPFRECPEFRGMWVAARC